jgi:hypothetical protein
MARSITIKAIDRRADRTYIRVGKSEIELHVTTIAELREWVRQQFEESDEKILALALACLFARDPNLTNPNQIVGRTITLNLSGTVNTAGAVLRVQ